MGDTMLVTNYGLIQCWPLTRLGGFWGRPAGPCKGGAQGKSNSVEYPASGYQSHRFLQSSSARPLSRLFLLITGPLPLLELQELK